MYFFGSKAHLFVEAVRWPFDPADVIPQLVEGDPEQAGERLVRFVIGIWDDEADRGAVMTMLRSASADPRAAKLLREFLVQELFGPLIARLGRPDDACARTS